MQIDHLTKSASITDNTQRSLYGNQAQAAQVANPFKKDMTLSNSKSKFTKTSRQQFNTSKKRDNSLPGNVSNQWNHLPLNKNKIDSERHNLQPSASSNVWRMSDRGPTDRLMSSSKGFKTANINEYTPGPTVFQSDTNRSTVQH